MSDQKMMTPEECEEFECQLIEDTALRLGDLAMALCHYDPALAKEAVAVVLGDLLVHYQEGLSFDTIMEVIKGHLIRSGLGN